MTLLFVIPLPVGWDMQFHNLEPTDVLAIARNTDVAMIERFGECVDVTTKYGTFTANATFDCVCSNLS